MPRPEFLPLLTHSFGWQRCTGSYYVRGSVHKLALGRQQADNNQVSEWYSERKMTWGKATKSGQGAIWGHVVRAGLSKISHICLWLFSEMTFEQRSPEGI